MSGEQSNTAEVWSWWASLDEENFTVGPCGTRDEVIAAAREDFDGEGFHIVEATKSSPLDVLPAADRLIADALEAAADDGWFGEDGDYDLRGRPDVCDVAIAELDSAIKAWGTKWANLLPTPWRFKQTRNADVVAGEREDGDAA